MRCSPSRAPTSDARGCATGVAHREIVTDREGGSPASHIPAPESFTTVAAFRPWRNLQTIVAREPTGPPLNVAETAERKSKNMAERAGFEPAKRFNPLTHFPGVLLQPLGHLSGTAAQDTLRRLLRQGDRLQKPGYCPDAASPTRRRRSARSSRSARVFSLRR